MKSLVDTLAAPPLARPAGKSRMDVWADTLPTAEKEAVLAAVVNPAWPHRQLLQELQAAGAPELSDNSFAAWRRKKGWKPA